MTNTEAGFAQRAAAMIDLGRAAEAEVLIRDGLRQSPEASELLWLLALATNAQHRFAEASEHARAAIARDPEDARYFSALASVHRGTGHHDAALDAIGRALSLAPGWSFLHTQQADVYLASGRPESAISSARQARELDPVDADAAAVLAAALYDDGRLDEARDAVHEALGLDPENVNAHRVRGMMGLRTGSTSEAIEGYRQALRLDPKSERARQGLSIALRTRNPLYRWLLQFSVRVGTLPAGRMWLVTLAPLFASRALRTYSDQPWAIAILVLLWGAFALVWATSPITTLVLMASQFGRAILEREAKIAAATFGVLAVLSVGCFVASMSLPNLLGVGVAFGLLAVVAGATDGRDEDRRRPVFVGLGVLVLCALGALALAVTGGSPGPLVAIAILGGVVGIRIISIQRNRR